MSDTLEPWQMADDHMPNLSDSGSDMKQAYAKDHLEAIGPIGLIVLPGMEDFAHKLNQHLIDRRTEDLKLDPSLSEQRGYLRDDYSLEVQIHRSGTGEGKAHLLNTARGHDIFILVDVVNYAVTYPYHDVQKPITPDEHYQNLRSAISAVSGKARRINVIMPYLYEGRQHKRNMRESLDAAYMLEELGAMGVENLLTFDAHDPRVSNAIPLLGFESIQSAYQMFKAIFRELDQSSQKEANFMVISPDEGGIDRAMYFAAMLGSPLGVFYKRRDFTVLQNGRNPVVAHQFLGKSPEGRDVLIVDDMISSGGSMLEVAKELKERKANRIYCLSTFGLFTDGLDAFDRAYEEGYIDKVFCTNLIYRTDELLQAPWFVDVDLTKFVALLIDSLNMDGSLSSLITPTRKIENILTKHGINRGHMAIEADGVLS